MVFVGYRLFKGARDIFLVSLVVRIIKRHPLGTVIGRRKHYDSNSETTLDGGIFSFVPASFVFFFDSEFLKPERKLVEGMVTHSSEYVKY